MKIIDFIERTFGVYGVLVAVAVLSVSFKYFLIRAGLEVGSFLPDNVIFILSLAGPTSVGAVIATATDLLYGTSGLINQISAAAINLNSTGKILDLGGIWNPKLTGAVAKFLVMAYRALKFGENGFRQALDDLEAAFSEVTDDLQTHGAGNELAFLLQLKSEMVAGYLAAEERLEREIFPTQIITSVLSLGTLLVIVLFSKTENMLIGLVSSALIGVVGSMWLLTIFWSDEKRGRIQGKIAANVSTLLKALVIIGAPEAIATATKVVTTTESPTLGRVRQTVRRVVMNIVLPLIGGLLLVTVGIAGLVNFAPAVNSWLGYLLMGILFFGFGTLIRVFSNQAGELIIAGTFILIPMMVAADYNSAIALMVGALAALIVGLLYFAYRKVEN